jgi:ribosome-associated heat shock protein Hsp15
LGRVDVNGQPAKPHREIRTGDEVVISRPLGRKQTVVVEGLAERHLAKAEARALYDDRTPKPTEAEVEMRRMARLARAFTTGPVARPDKRERRRIRQIKEG